MQLTHVQMLSASVAPLNRMTVMFNPWRAVYRRTHGEYLILVPADDCPLQERLDKLQAAIRPKYEQESGYWRSEIERRKTAPLEELKIASEDKRSNFVKEAEKQFDIVESENPIDGDGVRHNRPCDFCRG